MVTKPEDYLNSDTVLRAIDYRSFMTIHQSGKEIKVMYVRSDTPIAMELTSKQLKQLAKELEELADVVE